MPKHSATVTFIATSLFSFVSAGSAQNTTPAERAIEGVIPPGWVVVERKSGEIPWGHHWCSKYEGVTGIKLVIRGTSPSRSRFLGSDDQWHDVVVGVEALDVWIMPGSYRESASDLFCFHRPLQPSSVIELRGVRVYARPDSHANPDEKRVFDSNLSGAKAVQSPESPWNDPVRLSWRTWKADINAAVASAQR